MSKLWKAKFSLLCDVIFLVRLQGNFDIDHSHLGVQGLNHAYPFAAEHVGPSSWPFADWVLPSVMGWHSLTCHHLLEKHLKTQPHLVILIWWIDFLALHHTNAVSGSEYCRYDEHFFSLTFEQALNPPIFFTMAANLVYCESSSLTSLVEAPAPRATRAVRLGWRENNFTPLGLSSSGKVMGFTGQIPSGKQDYGLVMRTLSQGKEGDTFHHPVCFWPQNNYYSEARSQQDCRNYENPQVSNRSLYQ